MAPATWPDHTSFIVATYWVYLVIFIVLIKKKWATRTISPSMVDKPDVENLMSREEARVRSFLTWNHVAAWQYINGFMSALPGIALLDEQFTKKFLPDFSASQAAHHNPYPICNFVDRGVLLLLTIYDAAVIVGLLLYAKLSGKLSLGHMVVITPLALCVGVIISFPAGNLFTLIVGRFFMGLAVGFVFQINKRLAQEFAPQPTRIKLLGSYNISYLGSMTSYAMAYYALSHGHLCTLHFMFLIYSLAVFSPICTIILVCDSGKRAPVTLGQFVKSLTLPQLNYQLLIAVLGLDLLLQHMPQYFSLLNFNEDERYLASLSVSLITVVFILIAAWINKLERFGLCVLSVIGLTLIISVANLQLLLDLPALFPGRPGILIFCGTGVYCAILGLSKIDLEILETPEADVRHVMAIVNRVVASVVNIIILLFIPYLGCIWGPDVLTVFVGVFIFMYALCDF